MKRCTPLVLLLLCACSAGLPPEATKAVESANAALVAGDKAGFLKHLVPDQREGVLGLAAGYPIDVGKKPNELTAEEVLDAMFFTEIKGAKIAEDGAQMTGDDTARLIVSFDYGERTFVTRTFRLVKHGDEWLIDFKATLEFWHSSNGASALSVLQLK